MGVGKIAAQVGHAGIDILTSYWSLLGNDGQD